MGRLEAILGVLDRSFGDSGPSWTVLERSGAVSGASWAVLERPWAVSGSSEALPNPPGEGNTGVTRMSRGWAGAPGLGTWYSSIIYIYVYMVV